MPERTHEFGKYGATGVKGHEILAHRLDSLADFITTPVTTRRGLMARLRYLTRTPHARAAARDAGLTVTDRTLKAWLAGTRNPTRQNLSRIEIAYRTLRRRNVARYLLARLNRAGRGTRVEIHPLNQSGVSRPRQRVVEFRTLNIRHWEALVDAWSTGDTRALDDAWTDQIVDLGSQWGQYEYVTNIGFAA
ncbi:MULTISPECIES: transcriptional regulator [unclassified Streptomyces]|uniref:transcriptional regulator n=1 Tax=unclassified Streptomyces TaxID=2593676 RepID=UPI000DAEAE3C|nr:MULTISPECIES: transcriptional regulator [unclassified Streptomyces]PZT71616.1 transcriptional regulator [Streptomyces sp. AC1-42T]PZT73257.1 transcriptional regulator [Streptomyces sp. AC1-42W]